MIIKMFFIGCKNTANDKTKNYHECGIFTWIDFDSYIFSLILSQQIFTKMKKTGILWMLLAMMMTGAVSCNEGKKNAQNEEQSTQGTVAEVQQPKTDRKVIVARLIVKEGQEQAFIEVASKLVTATRQEPGNLFYSLYQSPLNPVEFIFYEEYTGDAAFQAHASSAHFAAFSEGIKELTAGDLIVDEF
jgi:quinol monooxygenase YgiN